MPYDLNRPSAQQAAISTLTDYVYDVKAGTIARRTGSGHAGWTASFKAHWYTENHDPYVVIADDTLYVIANGRLEDKGQSFDHFMAVVGRNTNGNYVVNDPWTNRQLEYTGDQLRDFLAGNSMNGGAMMGHVVGDLDEPVTKRTKLLLHLVGLPGDFLDSCPHLRRGHTRPQERAAHDEHRLFVDGPNRDTAMR